MKMYTDENTQCLQRKILQVEISVNVKHFFRSSSERVN